MKKKLIKLRKRFKPSIDKNQIFIIPSFGITKSYRRQYRYNLAFAWLTFRFSIGFYDSYKRGNNYYDI